MVDDDPRSTTGGSNGGKKRLEQLTRDSQITDHLDTTFDLLRRAQRRYLLYYLHGMEGEVAEFEETVKAVCAYEAAGRERDESSAQQRVRINLHHAHLPHLDEAGIIDYDCRQGTIRFTDYTSLEEWLEHARYMEID